MKKILKYSVLSVFVLAAVSCKGFLDENPLTQVSEKNAFASESALESTIFGCYQALTGDAMITGNMNEFVHNASGLLHWNVSTSRFTDIRWSGALKLAIFSQNAYNYSQYVGFYKLVNRCNNLIEHLDTSPVDEDYKNEIKGEALFLRATAYYYIVRCWGDSPIYEKSPTTMEEANGPRMPFWKLYDIVIDDYTEAFKLMRSYDRMVAVSGASSGRSCNYAAKAMLSEVYLTIASLLSHPSDNFWDDSDIQKKYGNEGINSAGEAFKKICGIEDAEAAYDLAMRTAQEVIDSKVFELAPTYHELFRYTLQDSDDLRVINHDWELKERIFTITNTVECSTNNYTEIRSLPLGMEGTAHTNSSIGNSNAGRFRPTRWLFQHWCEDYNHGTSDKGTGTYSKAIYVKTSDPRLNETIMHTRWVSASTGKATELYPGGNAIMCTVSSTNDIYYRKYAEPRYNADSGYADFYVMRYAEMFLIVAEAAANLSKGKGDENWNKAFENIEIIHKRARTLVEGDGGTGSDFPKWEADRFDAAANPLQALQDAIFWERMYEMTFEGHEYFDTHRSGAGWLSRVIARPHEAFLNLNEQKYSSGTAMTDANTVNGYRGKKYTNGEKRDFKYPSADDLRKSLLFAFPNSEITNNTVIKMEDQNKYYWQ